MKELTKKICWELVSINKDTINAVGAAIYRKPTTNECYEQRSQNEPPICDKSDDPNAAWKVPLQACLHKVPVDASERGSQWPEQWPARLDKVPYWLLSSQTGAYGKPAPEDFAADYEHWKRVVNKSYLTGMGINWSSIRNVMDMRSVYGGFAAALKDLKVWVMNIVTIDSPDFPNSYGISIVTNLMRKKIMKAKFRLPPLSDATPAPQHTRSLFLGSFFCTCGEGTNVHK